MIENKNRFYMNIFLTIIVGIIVLFFIFPLYILIITSFKPALDIFDMRLIPRAVTIANFTDVIKSQNFLQYIYNSLFVAVITTSLSLFLQSTSAYALSRLKFRGKNKIFVLIISTMMIPFSIIIIPLFIITKDLNLLNSLWGMIIPIAANGYGVFLLRQFFYSIPMDLDESAFIDGASHYTIFFRILLPLCKPILITLGASYFIFNWNNYLWPVIVSNNQSQWLVQVAITSFQGQHGSEWNLILAASVVACLPIFILFSFFQRYLVEGIKTSGIKG
jgi:multiple sugar transport system permease protein